MRAALDVAVGLVATAAAVLPLAAAAGASRRRWWAHLGDDRTALARLAVAVLTLAAVVLVAEALGTVGQFRPAPFVATCWAVSVAVARSCGEPLWRGVRAPARRHPPQEPRRGVAVAAVAAAVAAVAVRYAAQGAASLRRGIADGDTLWYHAPFATRFVQSGWTSRLLATHDEPFVGWFPATAELVASVPMLLTGRDVVLVAVNLGWLALGVAAAWAVAGPAGAVAATSVLGLPVMVVTQGGTGRNDTAAVALVLAATAFVVRDPTRPGGLAGGLAAGLAAGVKLTALPVVGLLTVAVGRRRLWPWCAGAVAGGGYFYARNLVRAGTPFPWTAGDAPGTLASAATPADAVTALGDAWGPGFPVLVAAAVAGTVAVARRGARAGVDPPAAVRGPAVAALAALATYPFTPNTADASAGLPRELFLGLAALNARYALPALAVAAVLATLAVPRRVALLVAVPLAAAAHLPTAVTRGFEWDVTAPDVALAALAVAVAAAAAAAGRLVGRPVLAAVVVAGVAVTAATPAHLERRYDEPRPANPASLAYPWFGPGGPSGARVAVAGGWFQHPFAGPDLSNHVEHVGGESCREWRRRLDAGRFRVLVVVPRPLADPDDAPRERSWIEGSGAELVRERRGASLWRLPGPVGAGGCPGGAT